MRPWNVRIDISGINPIIKQMEMTDEVVKDACEYALKMMRNPLIKEVKRLVCARYNVDESAVARRLTQHIYASSQQLSIFISGRPLNLISFNGTTPDKPPIIQRDTSKNKRSINIKGKFVSIYPAKPYKINVEIIRGQRKNLELEDGGNPFVMSTSPDSILKMPFFIAQNKNGNVRGVNSVSIPQMISNENVKPHVEQFGKTLFMKHFHAYANVISSIK